MWEFNAVSYARKTPYYEFIAMEESVKRCHALYKKKKSTYDTLYMLKVIEYRELQKYYGE